MFLDEEHLQITQSHNTTNYPQSVLHAQPGWDLSPKLHVLVYLFVTYQRFGTIYASYILQTSVSIHNLRSEDTRLSKFICSLLKLRGYLSTLHVTN